MLYSWGCKVDNSTEREHLVRRSFYFTVKYTVTYEDGKLVTRYEDCEAYSAEDAGSGTVAMKSQRLNPTLVAVSAPWTAATGRPSFS
jgi:hypothetical protein